MKEIFEISRKNGAKGVFLSGAGPTLIAILDKNYQDFKIEVSKQLKQNVSDWTVDMISPDNEGVKISVNNE
jgi:homoserine kinase